MDRVRGGSPVDTSVPRDRHGTGTRLSDRNGGDREGDHGFSSPAISRRAARALVISAHSRLLRPPLKGGEERGEVVLEDSKLFGREMPAQSESPIFFVRRPQRGA